MKNLVLIIAFLFTGLTYSSNIEIDVGIDEGDQITTMKAEMKKHEQMIVDGWEFVLLKIKKDSKGVFLVINYRKSKAEILYCSKYIKDLPKRYRPNERTKNLFETKLVNGSSGGIPASYC